MGAGHAGFGARGKCSLKAREKALKEEEKADAKELKAEISKLGITVREKGSRQYWRIYKTPSA